MDSSPCRPMRVAVSPTSTPGTWVTSIVIASMLTIPINGARCPRTRTSPRFARARWRSEEHTSELQSQSNLVCRLLLEKKKKKKEKNTKKKKKKKNKKKKKKT